MKNRNEAPTTDKTTGERLDDLERTVRELEGVFKAMRRLVDLEKKATGQIEEAVCIFLEGDPGRAAPTDDAPGWLVDDRSHKKMLDDPSPVQTWTYRFNEESEEGFEDYRLGPEHEIKTEDLKAEAVG